MKVICISGKARHGKDFFAQSLKKNLTDFGFTVNIIHYADLLKHICKNMFEWNGEKDEHGRKLLQYVGTDVIRKARPDFWVEFVTSILKLFPNEWDYVLIPDCRFPNEITNLKEEGFDVLSVRIFRPSFDNGLSKDAKNHKSETALDNFIFDNFLINSGNEDFLQVINDFALKL